MNHILHPLSGQVTRLLLLLVCIFSFTACLEDDYDACQTGICLRFTYLFNSQYTDLFPTEVNQLEIYVYDRDGKHLFTHSLNNTPDAQPCYLPLPDGGDYRIVVWGNRDEAHYECSSENRLKDLCIRVIADSDNVVQEPPCSLFYGSLDFYVKKYRKVEHTIDLNKNTNRIRVNLVKPDGSSANPSLYGNTLHGSNGSYDHTNCFVDRRSFQYLPRAPRTLLYNGIESEFTMQRLFCDDEPITLRMSSEGIGARTFEYSLVDELLKHPNINTDDDLERQD